MTSLAETQLDCSKARYDLRTSAYIDHQYHFKVQENEVGHPKQPVGPDSLRLFGIGDYLNDYTRYVDEMSAIDPLPALISTKPFPDVFANSPKRETNVDVTKRWPCTLRQCSLRNEIKVQTRFPRYDKDWLHNWSEYMYRIGEFGSKEKK